MKTATSPRTITIQQVENGYIVSETSEYTAGRTTVYQSMAELSDALENHFTHRSTTLLTDQP